MLMSENERTVFVMSKRKNLLCNLGFWGVLVLAFTAEGWVNFLCRLL